MKLLRNDFPLAWLSFFLGMFACLPADCSGTQPVIRTGVASATQDKPQCKLWFAHEQWWAWLPTPDGSAVYARSSSGWIRLSHLDEHLKGLPGQADVWLASDSVRAVLVGDDRLATADLVYDAVDRTYQPGNLRLEFQWTTTVQRDRSASRDELLETATICQDNQGRWWIAYDRGRSVYVKWTTDPMGMSWSDPISLANGLAPDDICSLYALADRVGVIWSNQVQEAVVAREHLLGSAPEYWLNPVDIQRGDANADDHLHCAVDQKGVLFVASKNSFDQIDKPQHILRVRQSDGTWTNYGYATLTATSSPTRPIAVTGGNPEQLFLLHTVAQKSTAGSTSKIVGVSMSVDRLDLAAPQVDVIVGEHSINNVTCPRQAFPGNAPWIVLASDSTGQVYEADLRGMLKFIDR
jgi:hypothetical protein